MTVTVKFAVAERSAELFKTAVFRFMELKVSGADEDLIVRTTKGPGPDWVHVELEFANPDLADEFNLFMGRLRLEVKTAA